MNPLLWLLNIAKWLDIGLNVVVLASSRVETFSRRAGMARDDGKRWGCVICRVLDLLFSPIHKNHCAKAARSGEIL